MSSPNKRQKLGEESDLNDEEIALLFDHNSTLKSSKRVLEAISPIFKTSLNECEHNGTLRLRGTSKEAWVLILHYLESEDPSSCISSEITEVSADTLVDVVKQCQMHGIKTLPETIDERVAKDIAMEDPRARRLSQAPAYEYLYISLDDGCVNFVRQNEMVKSEKALAGYLANVIKENEITRRERVEAKKKPHVKGFESAVGRILSFINEMHKAERYRFCFLFARRLMLKRLLGRDQPKRSTFTFAEKAAIWITRFALDSCANYIQNMYAVSSIVVRFL